ncbi:MAG TPA: 2-dehydropantoate 2-reductase N-terminal domain-containing protein [Dehalococcoidia bacterium]|nr:2-dehydropantoate 2-reductase N-terminal domain-containing protein [Dehalococcoidia bacterium]
MRYIVYGAGAVGGAFAGKLNLAGIEAVLIARGDNLRVLRESGLRLKHTNPDATESLHLEVVGHPSEIAFRPDDAVLLTMKSQDTIGALEDLRLAAGDQIPVVCCQNGVENERQALRRFANVYGALVIMATSYLQPGSVDVAMWPISGVADLGRYPEGVDATAEAIAADLARAGFVSHVDPSIMRMKYSKLHQNMVNALQALLPPNSDSADVLDQLRNEATACFAAAGIDWAPTAEMMARNAGTRSRIEGIGGGGWRGGSTWQSIARGAGSSETDYLNGEIVLLGRLHGIPTPANETVQLLVERLARSGGAPGTMTTDELRQAIAARTQVS